MMDSKAYHQQQKGSAPPPPPPPPPPQAQGSEPAEDLGPLPGEEPRSGLCAAWNTTYNMRGATAVLKTPPLWKMMICPLILAWLGSLAIFIILMCTAFPYQAHAMEENTILNMSAAWFISFIVTLAETAAATAIILGSVYASLQQMIFDKTYELRMSQHAAQSREKLEKCCPCCTSCGYLIILRIALAIVTSPLNLVPLLGTWVWALINGNYYAWSLHLDYFTWHGVNDFHDQHRIVRKHAFYTTFGTTAMFLETMPFGVGTFFIFANAAGAAIYAAEREPAMQFNRQQEAKRRQQERNVNMV